MFFQNNFVQRGRMHGGRDSVFLVRHLVQVLLLLGSLPCRDVAVGGQTPSSPGPNCSPEQKWLSFAGRCSSPLPMEAGPLLCGDMGISPDSQTCGMSYSTGDFQATGDYRIPGTLNLRESCVKGFCEDNAGCGGYISDSSYTVADQILIYLVYDKAGPPVLCGGFTAEGCPSPSCSVNGSNVCVQACAECVCHLPVDSSMKCGDASSAFGVGGYCKCDESAGKVCDKASGACVTGVPGVLARDAEVLGVVTPAPLEACPSDAAAAANESNYVYIGQGFCHHKEQYVDHYRVEVGAPLAEARKCCMARCEGRGPGVCIGYEVHTLVNGNTACLVFVKYANQTDFPGTFHSGTGGARPIHFFPNTGAMCYWRSSSHTPFDLHLSQNCSFVETSPELTESRDGLSYDECFAVLDSDLKFAAATHDARTGSCLLYSMAQELVLKTLAGTTDDTICMMRTFSVDMSLTGYCCTQSGYSHSIHLAEDRLKEQIYVSNCSISAVACRVECLLDVLCSASYYGVDSTTGCNVCFKYSGDFDEKRNELCGSEAGTCLPMSDHKYRLKLYSRACTAPLSDLSEEECLGDAPGALGLRRDVSDSVLQASYPSGCWYDSKNGQFHYNDLIQEGSVHCMGVDGQCHSVCADTIEVNAMQFHGCQLQSLMSGSLLFGPIGNSSTGLTYGDCYVRCMGSPYFSLKYSQDSSHASCWCGRDDVRIAAIDPTNPVCEYCHYGGALSVASNDQLNCIYNTTNYPCFFLLGARKICPGGTVFPDIQFRTECEALCMTQTTCTHINWYELLAVKCELVYVCSSATWEESRHGSVYERTQCTLTPGGSYPNLIQVGFPEQSLDETAGTCNERRISDAELAVYGFCNFLPTLKGYTCKQPTSAESLQGYYGAVVNEASAGSYVCVCSAGMRCLDTGLCEPDTVTAVFTLVPRDPIRVDGAIVAQYVGPGACSDQYGDVYVRYSQELTGLLEDPDAVRERCFAAAIAATALACGVRGIQLEATSDSTLRCSLLVDSSTQELPGWFLLDADLSGSTLFPSQSDGAALSLCYAFTGGSCSIADGCRGCSGDCTLTDGVCRDSSNATCTVPCFDATQGMLRQICDAGSRDFFELTPRRLNADWPTLVLDQGGILLDYVQLVGAWETCEAAGYTTLTTDIECRRALCSAINATLPGEFTAAADAPQGCALQCNGKDCHSVVSLQPAPSTIPCTDPASTCLCRRVRGPSVSAAACSGTGGSSPADAARFALQSTGYGCGSPDPTATDIVSALRDLSDITSLEECITAACTLLGVAPDKQQEDSVGYIGGYPISDSAGLHDVYTGAAHEKWASVDQLPSDRWRGGCSALLNATSAAFQLFFAPENACGTQGTPAGCASPDFATECVWNTTSGSCGNRRGGFSLCTAKAPCLCRASLKLGGGSPPGPVPVTGVGSTTCPINVEHWGSGAAVQCDPCQATTADTFSTCGDDGMPDIYDATVNLAAGETKTVVFNSYGDPDSHIVVKKHFLAGKTVVGVMFGAVPSMDHAMPRLGPDGKAWYHCRSDILEAQGDNTCILPACGPFAVSVMAPSSVASLRLTICSSPYSSRGPFAGMVPSKRRECCATGDSTCAFAFPQPVVGGVSVAGTKCICEAGFQGEGCGQCTPGRFPTPGTVNSHLDGVEPCSLQCRECDGVPCGTLNPANGTCSCISPELSGVRCEGACRAGRYGTFCNETYPELSISITRAFSNVVRAYSPPPWAMAPNSRMELRMSATDMSSLSSVRLTAKRSVKVTGAIDPEASAPVRAARGLVSSDSVIAAYYGPLRTARTSRTSVEDVYLHVFKGGFIRQYSYNHATKKFVLVNTESIDLIYGDSCRGHLGADFASNLDAALFLQDYLVEQADLPVEVLTEDTVVLIRGSRYCAVGSPFYQPLGELHNLLGLFTTEGSSGVSPLRGGYTKEGCPEHVMECLDADQDYWDAVTTYAEGPESDKQRQSIAFIKNGTVVALERVAALAYPVSSQVLKGQVKYRTVSSVLGVPDAVANPTAAAAVGHRLQADYPADQLPPAVVFSHSRVYLSTGVSAAFSHVFEDTSAPHQLVITGGPSSGVTAAPASVATGPRSINFTLVLRGLTGRSVSVNNDGVIPILQECGQPLSVAQSAALARLKARELSAGADPALLDRYVVTEEDCWFATSGASLIGDDSSGVFAGATPQVDFTFSSLAVGREGRYRIVFRHLKTGLEAVSGVLDVTATDCDSPDLFDQAEECVRDCALPSPPPSDGSAVSCELYLSNNKRWVELDAVTTGYTTVTFSLLMAQRCCSGNGLCCVGNASCSEHQPAFDYTGVVDQTRCTCLEDPVKGYWDQRAHSNCMLCKAGFTGSNCEIFVGRQEALHGLSNVALDAGESSIFVVPVTPETPVEVRLSSNAGDADALVTFGTCPGQGSISQKPLLAKGEIAVPCTGRGACHLDQNLGPVCHCDPGYFKADCSAACCSLNGRCDPSGTGCQCFSDPASGFWEKSATACKGDACSAQGGADSHPAAQCVMVEIGGPIDEDYRRCTDKTAPPPNTEARLWLSWRGLSRSTSGKISHGSIRFAEADSRCNSSRRVYVYATRDAHHADVVAGSFASGESPCGVHNVTSASLTCGSSATFDEATDQCVCNPGFRCLRGTCAASTNPVCGEASSSTCNGLATLANGTCSCPVLQEQSDEVIRFSCEEGWCEEVHGSLRYTWTGDALVGRNATEKAAAERELEWAAVPGAEGVRFFQPVTSFVMPPPVGGSSRSVDITAWLQRNVESIRTADFDLSFVFVMPADSCKVSFHGVPSLVLKTHGDAQPSRLFLSAELEAMSDRQKGHPYYTLLTADSQQDARGAVGSNMGVSKRRIKRYVTKSRGNVTSSRPRENAECSSTGGVSSPQCSCGKVSHTALGGTCSCPQEAVFQDPVDFVQVGGTMFFLAITDWESTPDGSASCNKSYADNAQIYQGPRELFFTKGLPKDRNGDDSDATASQFRHGSGSYPTMQAVTQAAMRQSVLGSRTYTRAKELTKMENPDFEDCMRAPPCVEQKEMLVYVATDRGGDTVTVNQGKEVQEKILSSLVPQLWRIKVEPATDLPAAQPELIAGDVIFPSFPTALRVPTAGGTARSYIFFLAQEKFTPVNDDYSPLGDSPGYANRRSNHQYLVESRVSVYASDGKVGSASILVASATSQNVPVCTHVQGHPGFTLFQGKVYFHFDSGGGDGIRLHSWDPADPKIPASAVTLAFTPGEGENATALAPSLPPLSRGYFKPAVSPDGAFLYLSLGAPSALQSPGGCLGFGEFCGYKVHSYQKSFPCVNPGRGEVELWRWDGVVDSDAPEGVHLARVAAGFPDGGGNATDPKWLTATPSGLFWVGHRGGMTNIGAHLSKNVSGVILPAEQYISKESQSLWFAPYPERDNTSSIPTSTAQLVWDTDTPSELYGFTLWGDSLLFWGYDPDALSAGYADFNGSSSACFPPGRLQEVSHTETPLGRRAITKMMSGVNIPAFEGCPRHLYSVAVSGVAKNASDGVDVSAPEGIAQGSPNDGVGVPRRQCCPSSFGVGWLDWSNSTEDFSSPGGAQAGRACSPDSDPSCVATSATRSSPLGCIPCYLPRMSYPPTQDGLDEDFVYPTYLKTDLQNYTMEGSWGHPHTGWWFTGFQSIWVSEGASRASGEHVNFDGGAVNEHIRGNELYRPGGFAWREHWPDPIGVFTEVPLPPRDDCDDCAPGFYGTGCAKRCPISTASLEACPLQTSREQCESKPCLWDAARSVCHPGFCNGSPCSDRFYGNGTCLCAPGTAGTACEETGPADLHDATAFASEDAAFTLTSPCAACLSAGCTASNGVGYCGLPSTAECAEATCGKDSDEPCCGRGPEPLQVSSTRVAVLGFAGVQVPAALLAATLRLNEAPGRGCDAPQEVTVSLLGSGVVGRVEGMGFMELAEAMIPAVPIGSFVTGRTWEGVVHAPLDVSKLGAYLGTDASFALALTSNGSCGLQFKPAEYRDDWIAACKAARGCGGGAGAPGLPVQRRVEHSALLTVTGHGVAGSAGGGRQALVASAGAPERRRLPLTNHYAFVPSSRAMEVVPAAESGESPFLKATMKGSTACVLRGQVAEEECVLLAPISAGFVFVQVSAFEGSTVYSMNLTHTPRGYFGAANRLGECVRSPVEGHWDGELCLDCHYRYDDAGNCTTYSPVVCDDTTCPAGSGVCVDDVDTENWRQMCQCNAGLFGVACDVACDETVCNPALNGVCLPTGVCDCYANNTMGYWEGANCGTCQEGYYGPTCTKCECRYGTCDNSSSDGRCAGACQTGRTGAFCSECDVAAGYYGTQHCVLCTSDTCQDGVCNSKGTCVCNTNYFPDGDGVCTYCNATDTCNGHGACNAVQGGAPCACDAQWDTATNCSSCQAANWGADCSNDCWCNLHGTCNQETGVCECYNDDVRGHFTGPACERCSEGYSSSNGVECTSQGTATGTARIGRPFDFSSSHWAPKRLTAGTHLRGAVFHSSSLNVEREGTGTTGGTDEVDDLLGGTAREVLLAAAGQSESDSVPVEVWVKPYDTATNFDTHWVKNLSVHTRGQSLDSAKRGDSVLGMFQTKRFVYFVVQDGSHPYVGRLWLAPGCDYCVFPNADDGLRYTNQSNLPYTQGSTCAEGCSRGAQVLVNGMKGRVVLQDELSDVWVVTENQKACDTSTEACRAGAEFKHAHRFPSSMVQAMRTVVWVDPKGYESPTQTLAHRIVAWSHVPSASVVFVVVQRAVTLTDGSQVWGSYYLQIVPVGEDTFQAGLVSDAYELTEFKTVQQVHGFMNGDDLTALLFGENRAEAYVMQAIFPRITGDKTVFGAVVQLTLELCDSAGCAEVERVLSLEPLADPRYSSDKDAALLFVRTTSSSGETEYVIQRINLKKLKTPQAVPPPHEFCNQHGTATVCEANQCTWDTTSGGCVRVVRKTLQGIGRSGIGAVTLDKDFGYIYVAFGSLDHTKSSIVYKIDAVRLETMYTRTMLSRVPPDVESVVALTVDTARRAVYAVAHTTRTSVAVLNAYDVTGITPNVADAPIATTNITVTGQGFSSLQGQYIPKCMMGDTPSKSAKFVNTPEGLVIVCQADNPTSHSACTWLPLEITLNQAEVRYTATNQLMKRSNTALVLSDGLSTNVSDWIWPHTPGPVPTLPNIIENSAYRADMESAATGVIPGPTTDPFGSAPGDDQGLQRTTQQVCGGPINVDAVVVVEGAGFFDSPYLKCRFGDKETSGTFVTTMKMLCRQPQTVVPMQTTLEVSLDGQIFSRNNVRYNIVGPATSIEPFFICDTRLGTSCQEQNTANQNMAGELVIPSARKVTLLPLVIIFKDAIGTFVGSVWTRDTIGQVSISVRGAVTVDAESVLSVTPSEGRAVFDQIHLIRPLYGTYTIDISYIDSTGQMSSEVKFHITGGDPVEVEFSVHPPSFSNNREPLTQQPKIKLADEAGNPVLNTNYEIRAEISSDAFPEELIHNGQKAIELTEPTARFSGTTYDFSQLSVRTVASLPSTFAGRGIQFRQPSPLVFELLNFTVIFSVWINGVRDTKLNVLTSPPHALKWTMHMVDCSLDHIGRTPLAWLEPEEMATGSSTPITIKGWGFVDVGSHAEYRCQFRSPDDEVLLESVPATFVDSCSISCLPSLAIAGTPGMRLVQPALCCKSAEGVVTCPTGQDAAICTPDGSDVPISSFNETSVQKKYYHRYINPESLRVAVWNLATALPEWSLQTAHPYTSALSEQTTVEQVVSAVNSTQSVGVRLSRLGDYQRQQFNISDFVYKLFMYSDSIVNSESVLRASALVTIAGKNFWTEPDWQLSASVNSLKGGNGANGAIDTSFRVGLIDSGPGLHGWSGSWVADQQILSATQTALTSSGSRTIVLTIEPISTRGKSALVSTQYASVKRGEERVDVHFTVDGGQVRKNTYTTTTDHSYVDIRNVVMINPAAGTYRLTFSALNLQPASITITILEGVPHEAMFDSASQPGGVDGVPQTTQRTPKELAVQPRFRLLDVAGNTVQKLPAAHIIYARVKEVNPLPRCLEPCTPQDCDLSLPGMWGVASSVQGLCGWNTPPLSNTTEAAVLLRKTFDPPFDSTGVAAFGGVSGGAPLNIWASPDPSVAYNVTFQFYGAGLESFNYSVPDLTLPSPLGVSRCAENCSDGVRVCDYTPRVLDVSTQGIVSEKVVVFGDYFDFTQSRKTNDKLRVQLTLKVDTQDVLCEVPARRRDTCSIEVDYPVCRFLCVNIYGSDYTDADRLKCCADGVKVDNLPCNPTAAAGRSAEVLQSNAVSVSLQRALVSPSSVQLKVATSCVGSDCSAELSTLASAPGPPRMGPAAQLGVNTAVPSCLLSSSEPVQINVTVVSLDNSSNPIGARDLSARRINLYMLKSKAIAQESVWVDMQCTGDGCLLHSFYDVRSEAECAAAGKECVFFVTEAGLPADNSATMVGGSATFYVRLQAPLVGSYAFQAVDVSDVPAAELLPSCAGPHLVGGNDVGSGAVVPTANGTFHLPYPGSESCSVALPGLRALMHVTVCKGEPHKLAWATENPWRETRNTDTITEYILQVQDFAGNVLNMGEITTGGSSTRLSVYVNISRSVPELRDPLVGPTLFSRRGEIYEEPRISELEQLACSFELAKESAPNTVQLGGDINTAQVKFNVRKLRIWHGMSCVLNFTASGYLNGVALSEAERQVADRLNANSGNISIAVRPVACCNSTAGTTCSQFAYSFEFGCWDQALGRKITGPNNDGTTGALQSVSQSSTARYDCLYSCGECEPGMVCYGNTTVHSEGGFWREPVTYRGWECRSGKCSGTTLGKGLGEGMPSSLAEADTARSDRQCSVGTKGPICGVCERDPTPDAPHGYARSLTTCTKCPSPVVNIVLLVLSVIGVLLVILIMVRSSLNSSAKVQEVPKLGVMIKLLVSHLQVSGLAGDLAVRWGSLAKDIFMVESVAGGPTSNVHSVSCLANFDYYDKFVGWVVLPLAILVVPGIIVLLIRLLRSLGAKGRFDGANATEVPPPCQSPYHWMYDWSVPDKDVDELRSHLEKHSKHEGPKREWHINVEVRRIANPRKAPPLDELSRKEAAAEDEAVPIKIQRVANNNKGGFNVLWETNIELGEHGCWLCRRCCMLEQLFPTPGVGRIGEEDYEVELVKQHWYECDLESHHVTKKALNHLFKAELLEAAEARLEVLESLRQDFFVKGKQATTGDVQGIVNTLFHAKDAVQSKRRALAQAKTPPFNLAGQVHQPFDYPDLENRAAAGTSLTEKRAGVVVELTDEDINQTEVSLRRKKEQSLVYFLKEQDSLRLRTDDNGVKVADKLIATRQFTTKDDSYWRYQRTDAVTGEELEWHSHEDPITPPRSPKQGSQLTPFVRIPLQDDLKEQMRALELPDWYIEAEYPSLQDVHLPDKHLVPVPSTGKDLVVDIQDMARSVGYRELYAMARLRRMRDKFAEWKSHGLSDAEIKARLMNHGPPPPKANPIAITLNKDRYESQRDSTPEVGGRDGDKVQTLNERKKAVKEQDRKMRVLEKCGLCNDDFAVLFCPHCDAFYCESCDVLLHQYDSSSHSRLRPQPKTSLMAEAGFGVRAGLRDVYVVTVIVSVFLVYPYLVKEIALLLNCSAEICVSQGQCSSYLLEDPSIACSGGSYGMYRTLALAFAFLYGAGLPLVGFLVLREKRHKLYTKQTLGRLGFLYAGYRQTKYYWEMVTMLRKALLVLIVVALADSARYQLYAATWTITFFVFLTIFVKPFKYAVLWKLECLSLVSIMVTLNIGLLFFESLSDSSELALTAVVFGMNTAVLCVFLYFIACEFKEELYIRVDTDGDKDITYEELRAYVKDAWNNLKPGLLKSVNAQREEERKVMRHRLWSQIHEQQHMHRFNELPKREEWNTTAEFGYWVDYYRETAKRTNRFEWLASKKSNLDAEARKRVGLTDAELPTLWEHGLGDV